MRRIAAIDVGTNSVRCIVVEVPDRGPYRLLDDEKAYTRLGQGVGAIGRLSAEAKTRTIEALLRMAEICRSFEVERVRAVATSAVRSARDGARFVDAVKKATGFDLEVISEEEEGRLAFVSAAANFQLEGRVAVLDIGGGSVELVRSTALEIESVVSLPLGAVALSERYMSEDPSPPKSFKALKRHVRTSLAAASRGRQDPAHALIGSGGTITALAAMVARAVGGQPETTHGHEVNRADLVHLLAMLKRSTLEERLEIPGLPPSRADIITAGVVVVDEVMRALEVNKLKVNAKGIREGLILDTIAEGKAAPVVPDRMKGMLAFARRCRFDRSHALHVKHLALSIFDQLAGPLGLDVETRPLLEAAAVLHDVGYHISYDRHHKHSYHLIRHAHLPGISGPELEVVAAIARYHRGAPPKAGHESMRAVRPDSRDVVKRLGAVLRIADGLDRTRSQRVRSVAVSLDGVADDARSRLDGTVRLEAEGEGDLDVEVYGAKAKGDLFERVFGRSVEISSRGAPRGERAGKRAASNARTDGR